MTNTDEFTLTDALAKFKEWAEMVFVDEDAIISQGCVFSKADIEKRLADFESRTFEGYLLEFKMRNGSWSPYEVDTQGEFKFHCDDDTIWDEYINAEICVGFFKELGDFVWNMESDSWADRLEVDFDARTTPIETPSAEGVWEGELINEELRSYGLPTMWRVRRIKFKGTLSDKARNFLMENPLMEIRYTEKGAK